MNSRTKGKVGEREFAALLRGHGFDARRGQQFSGGADSPDVVSAALDWLHIEVKRVQNLNLAEACAQAKRDAGGKPWIVAHRKNRGPWFITLESDALYEMLRQSLSHFDLWPFAGPRAVTLDAELFFQFLREIQRRRFTDDFGYVLLPDQATRVNTPDLTFKGGAQVCATQAITDRPTTKTISSRHGAGSEQQQQTTKKEQNSMKIANPNSRFEPCPEFTGRAVIADVTPVRKEQSQFGEQEVFRVVFEVDMEKPDGSRFCVWSRRMTPTLGEKSNLRKFIRGLYGRDLTKPELANYDTEVLVGMGAQLVVVHEHKDGETYANIAACTPDKSGNPLKLSGKYVRVKDRPPKDSAGGQGAPAGNSGYRRTEQPAADGGDLGATKIHVGKCKGLEVRDLSPEQVGALIQNWLPTAKANAKPTADDKRLIAALESWQAALAVTATNDDDVPY